MHTKTKILILDEQADLLDALTIFFESQSINVCTVVSEDLFEDELMNLMPDIIILDVHYNGNCDGRRICKMIKSNIETKHIPVILMSTSEILLNNYKECDADAVINKPFDLLDLLEKINILTNHNIRDITKNRMERFHLKSLTNIPAQTLNVQNISYNLFLITSILYLFFY